MAYGRKESAARPARRNSERSLRNTNARYSPLTRRRVLARLEEPNLLVIETCIATGVRISEVLGLKWRNVNLDAGTIKIEQRVWHQELDRPKSENSRRVVGIGQWRIAAE